MKIRNPNPEISKPIIISNPNPTRVQQLFNTSVVKQNENIPMDANV